MGHLRWLLGRWSAFVFTGFRLLGTALLSLVLAACVSLPVGKPMPTAVAVVVLDPSGSTDTDRCAELGADLVAMLGRPRIVRLALQVLAVGDRASADEPRTVVNATYSPPTDLFEAPGAAERHRLAWAEAMVAECRAHLVAAGRSPVYRATERAVESISATCAQLEHEHARCAARALILHSDLRENVHPAIRAAILRAGRTDHRADVALPKLEVAGIEVAICGVSDTHAGEHEDAISPERLLESWRAILGADVPIAASCPHLQVATETER